MNNSLNFLTQHKILVISIISIIVVIAILLIVFLKDSSSKELSPTTISTLEKSAPTLSILQQSQSLQQLPVDQYIDDPPPTAPPVQRISRILGMDKDGIFYLKESFISPWVKQLYNTFSNPVSSIIQLKDYTFLGISSEGILWKNLDLLNGGEWTPVVSNSISPFKIKSITQLNDESFICISSVDPTLIYKKKTLTDVDWVQIIDSNSTNIKFSQIINLRDNTFIALEQGSSIIYKKDKLTIGNWEIKEGTENRMWDSGSDNARCAPNGAPHANLAEALGDPRLDYARWQYSKRYSYTNVVSFNKINQINNIQSLIILKTLSHTVVTRLDSDWSCPSVAESKTTTTSTLCIKENTNSAWIEDTIPIIANIIDIVSILV